MMIIWVSLLIVYLLSASLDHQGAFLMFGGGLMPEWMCVFCWFEKVLKVFK